MHDLKKWSHAADCVVSRSDEEESQKVMNWLSEIKYDSRHQESVKKYQEGTGKWFLDSPEYESWLQNDGQTLFCHGIPGAGKTILTSLVIKGLHSCQDNSMGIAYFYFSYDQKYDERDPLEIFRCLLKQLCEGLVSVPNVVKSFYNKHKGRTAPSICEVMETLQVVGKMYKRSFIVIDALDECPTSEGFRLKFIKQVKEFQKQTRANIFATSREIPEIMEGFIEFPNLKIRASRGDVRMFLDEEIPHLDFQRLLKGDFELQEAVRTKICDTADGMFLLASLLLNLLDGATDKAEIRRRLKELSSGSDAYDTMYKSLMIHRIEKQKGTRPLLAKRALAWITCAMEPLTIIELQHALAIQPNDRELNKDRVPELDTILSVCCGLVAVDEESNIIRLVHLTAQEYFKESRRKLFEDAHSVITSACITYLSLPRICDKGPCSTYEEYRERESLYPLYRYAAGNWGEHGREALVLNQDVIEFLENEELINMSSQYIFTPGASTKRMTGLHWAAFFGLEKAMDDLLLRMPYVEVRDSEGKTPLSHASIKGRHSIVERLLQIKNVDPDSKDCYGSTPLSCAAWNGHQSIVERLLQTDNVDPNSKGDCGRTPLSYAAGNGYPSTVERLLQINNVDPDLEDSSGRTPLWWAANQGHHAIVVLLLGRTVNANSRDRKGETPLFTAAEERRETAIITV
ncbi:ankyrin repeat protein [Xylaria sp. FL0933]|nr:ankyrin repeat protein [Xylaria sp. FL0933]